MDTEPPVTGLVCGPGSLAAEAIPLQALFPPPRSKRRRKTHPTAGDTPPDPDDPAFPVSSLAVLHLPPTTRISASSKATVPHEWLATTHLHPVEHAWNQRLPSKVPDTYILRVRRHVLATNDISVARACSAIPCIPVQACMSLMHLYETHHLFTPITDTTDSLHSLVCDNKPHAPILGCITCSRPLKAHFASVLVPDRKLCLDCFAHGRFDGYFSGSYIHICEPVPPVPNMELHDWTLDENILLLDAVKHFDLRSIAPLSQWEPVARYVGTHKNATDCVSRFISMSSPLESWPSYLSDPPPVPFALAPNPVLSLCQYLVYSIHGGLASAVARSALHKLGSISDSNAECTLSESQLIDCLQDAASLARKIALAEQEGVSRSSFSLLKLLTDRLEQKLALLDAMDRAVQQHVDRTCADLDRDVALAIFAHQ